jgi:flagellar biogenesis protein FliO
MLSCSLLLLWPIPVQALDFTGIDYRIESDQVRVAIHTTEMLKQPRIRSTQGLLRFWFPEIVEPVWMQVTGDGGAVKKIRLRPGYETTELLSVHLGDQRRIDPAAIRVTTEPHQTVIAIERSALPAVYQAPLSQPEAPKVEPAEAETIDAEATEKVEETGEPAAPLKSQKSGATLWNKNEREKGADSAKSAIAEIKPEVDRSQKTLLVTVVCVLGVILIAIKLFQKRTRPGTQRPEIDVVASRRLGPGFQLLIVRAFGQDHLLSINGKQTQRLASLSLDEAEALRLESEQDSGADAERSPLLRKKTPKKSNKVATEIHGSDATSDFDNVLSLAAARNRVTQNSSEAVQGLIRLREQLGR